MCAVQTFALQLTLDLLRLNVVERGAVGRLGRILVPWGYWGEAPALGVLSLRFCASSLHAGRNPCRLSSAAFQSLAAERRDLARTCSSAWPCSARMIGGCNVLQTWGEDMTSPQHLTPCCSLQDSSAMALTYTAPGLQFFKTSSSEMHEFGRRPVAPSCPQRC